MKNPWKRLSKINPQREDGNRQINSKVFNSLVKARLPTAEMSIVLTIISKTWGFNKNSDVISISQFSEETGFPARTIKRAKKILSQKRIIISSSSKRVLRGTPLNEYMFNKHYDTWKDQDIKKGDISDTRKKGDILGKKRVSPMTPTIESIQKKETVNLKKFTADFISYVKKTTPTKSPSSKNIFQTSLDTLEKLIRLDGFDEDYILKVIRWAAKDDFWQSQVYSLAGLRKKNKSSGLTKFQNISISFDKEQPEQDKPKIPVFRVSEYDRSTENAVY